KREAITWFPRQLPTADTSRGVLYVVGQGSSGQIGVSTFSVQSDGTLQQLGPATYPNVPAGSLLVDPQGRFLFDWINNRINVFALNSDGSIGAAVAGSPFAAGTPYAFRSPSDPNACFFAA